MEPMGVPQHARKFGFGARRYRRSEPRFLNTLLYLRVPFFLLFGFNKGALNKEQKGITQVPKNLRSPISTS